MKNAFRSVYTTVSDICVSMRKVNATKMEITCDVSHSDNSGIVVEGVTDSYKVTIEKI